ncbi:MAG: class I SAM-dependent methyltransferase [Acidobacteria bacterium]|nr:class I SAM-dependent methyltransferase [Acidobacteriota bacterium]
METNKVIELYDEEYAEAYDDRFIHTEGYKHVTDFEIELLKGCLDYSENWLDVACGTGYFLSQFKGKERAGIDLSPGMLKLAKSRNEDALFIKQQDFRFENPDFDAKWDLVSSMWGAYCYVESMTEINKFIKNISDWTSDDGICFLPIIDLEDVLYWRESLQYCNPDIQIFGGPSYVNGVIWSYTDNLHNKHHENMIAAHTEYLTEQLAKQFSRIDIVYYPPYPPPIPGQRKGLIATGKNGKVSETAAKIFDEIAVASNDNREKVLSMAALEEMLDPKEPLEVPQIEPSDKLQDAGWLRSIWRRSPEFVKKSVRKVIGE